MLSKLISACKSSELRFSIGNFELSFSEIFAICLLLFILVSIKPVWLNEKFFFFLFISIFVFFKLNFIWLFIRYSSLNNKLIWLILALSLVTFIFLFKNLSKSLFNTVKTSICPFEFLLSFISKLFTSTFLKYALLNKNPNGLNIIFGLSKETKQFFFVLS